MMKLYIKGMAASREATMRRLSSYARTIMYHVVKCVVYENTTNNLDHWVNDEIAEYLVIANNITVKPKNKKLKPADYEDSIFSMFGDSRSDAEVNLREFRIYNNKTKKYPSFILTDDLVDRMYQTSQKLISTLCLILATMNDLSRDDFANIVYDSLR